MHFHIAPEAELSDERAEVILPFPVLFSIEDNGDVEIYGQLIGTHVMHRSALCEAVGDKRVSLYEDVLADYVSEGQFFDTMDVDSPSQLMAAE